MKRPTWKSNDDRVSLETEAPPEIIKELVQQGLMDPTKVHLPPEDRCRCSHREGAHRGINETFSGTCRAHRCPCGGYVQDPRFILKPPEGLQVGKRGGQ